MGGRRQLAIVALAVALGTLITSCASFPDSQPKPWHDQIEGGGPLATPPRIPNDQPPSSDQPTPPPGGPGQNGGPVGCLDPDPQVVATCLNPLSAVAVLPDGQSALAAERTTGRILWVQRGKAPRLVATIPVDPSGGGLIGLVLSPSYEEDQLLYAYVATPSDHRVVRIAVGDPPVPVLTGIPPTPGDDSGALGVDRDGNLLVATGADTASPSPTSLAGKVLRIDTFGHPAQGNPDPHSPIYTTGLRAPAGLCTAPDTGAVWVTDHLANKDVLQRVAPGPVGVAAWNWPDKPGVAGCVAPKGGIAVAQRNGSALFLLRSTAPGAFTGTPQSTLSGVYGRLGPAMLAPDGLIWLGTVNKLAGGGKVASSDDRVIRLLIPNGGSGSGPD